MEILGDVKNYDWGKLGMESKVSKLASLNDESFVFKTDVPYSELWMGDHVSGQSVVKTTTELLGEYLTKNLDDNIGGKKKLSFLFKVLSIRKALSIQCHPSKEEAERLHASRPDLYKDPNHKPELAVAISPFQALCGFRPHQEIYNLLKSHSEIVELLGKENIELITKGSAGLKKCYSKLMHSNETALTRCIEKLAEKFKNHQVAASQSHDISKIFLQLNADFPNDVGCLSLFFLNVINLNAGEAIYLPAKIPHAYLSGDCIEVMACSDNVVRAGLTPKFKDTDTLLEMLIYDGESAREKLFKPYVLDENHPHTLVFKPNIEDFALAKYAIPINTSNYEILNHKFGSILLVLSGEAVLAGAGDDLQLSKGSIIFLPSKFIKMTVNVKNSDFICYQASSNE